jgi:hypothetical protein
MSLTLPTLPVFDIPSCQAKPLTTKDFYLLSIEGRKRMRDAGQLDELLADPRRQPVSKPFSLD